MQKNATKYIELHYNSFFYIKQFVKFKFQVLKNLSKTNLKQNAILDYNNASTIS